MEAKEVVQVDSVERADDEEGSMDKAIFARLMERFNGMGPEAKAMIRLFWLCQSIGGIANRTPAEAFTNELRIMPKPADGAFGDQWLAGFADCLEMVVDHT